MKVIHIKRKSVEEARLYAFMRREVIRITNKRVDEMEKKSRQLEPATRVDSRSR